MGLTIMKEPPPCFGKKAVSCQLKSLDDIVRCADWFQRDLWAFRGQYDSTWPLSTSVERKYPDCLISREEERRAIWNFKSKTRLLLPQVERSIDTLAAMQHYGVPTRLLDFTHSLFVALFFAFDKGTAPNDSSQHAVWAINIGRALEHSKLIQEYILNEIDAVKRATTVDDPAEMEETKKAVHNGLTDMLNQDVRARTDKTTELAERVLRGSISEEYSGILPIDIIGTNQRMAAQNGMFIMAIDFKPFEQHLKAAFQLDEELDSLPKVFVEDVERFLSQTDELALVKLVIDEDMHYQADRLLDAANISPTRLFPDLSGLATSIRYRP